MSLPYQRFVQGIRTLKQSWAEGGNEAMGGWEDVRVVEDTMIAAQTCLRITRRLSGIESCKSNQAGSTTLDSSDDDDEIDDEALPQHIMPSSASSTMLHYDIVYSPSYQVPVLYIHLHSPFSPTHVLPNLDEIYALLVPSSYQPQLRSVSILGALSLTEHPITGSPAYFVHPCRTQEGIVALSRDRALSPEEYLCLWMGLIGKGVGLDLPVEPARRMLGVGKVGEGSGDDFVMRLVVDNAP